MTHKKSSGGLVGKLLTLRATTWLWGALPIPIPVRTAIIWLLNPKFTVGVIGLVRDDQGRVLLLRHTYRPEAPWGLPGGGLRKGERLEECLHREIQEEAGIEVEIESLLSAATDVDRKLVDMIYYCHPLPGQTLATFKPNSEIAEARFCSLGDLPQGMSSGQRKLVQVALLQSSGDRSIAYEPERGEFP